MRPATTADQRRAYIDTRRRMQPIAELERKARKSISRRRRYTPETSDLTLAQNWRWGLEFIKTAHPPGGFCYLCHRFGVWEGEHPGGHYVAGPMHTTRCGFAPDDGPYPGWAAAGRPLPQKRVSLIEEVKA